MPTTRPPSWPATTRPWAGPAESDAAPAAADKPGRRRAQGPGPADEEQGPPPMARRAGRRPCWSSTAPPSRTATRSCDGSPGTPLLIERDGDPCRQAQDSVQAQGLAYAATHAPVAVEDDTMIGEAKSVTCCVPSITRWTGPDGDMADRPGGPVLRPGAVNLACCAVMAGRAEAFARM